MSNKKDVCRNVPKLRFPGFRDGPEWEHQKLGNIYLERVRNNQPEKQVLAATQDKGVIPYHTMERSVIREQRNLKAYKLVLPGDFIISLRSFEGGFEYSSHEGIISPAYTVLRSNHDGQPEFFRFYFKRLGFISLIQRNMDLSLRDGKSINYKQASVLQLRVPRSEEQQKIADCLSSINELIAAQRQKLDELKAHKKGLMQQLLPQEGETVPKLRFPEFRYAPKWEEKKAATLFINRTEGGEAGLPIYSVTMNDGMIKRSLLDRHFDDIAAPEGNKKAHKNDIAYNMMRMWQGAFGVVIEDCMVSPAYVILAPQDGVYSEFFGYLLKLPRYLRLLTSHSQGITSDRLRLYYKDFARIPLSYPAFSEQQKIAQCLASIDNLITAQTQKIEALNAHKRGLMQQLFPVVEVENR